MEGMWGGGSGGVGGVKGLSGSLDHQFKHITWSLI